jgi:hypothetical protein
MYFYFFWPSAVFTNGGHAGLIITPFENILPRDAFHKMLNRPFQSRPGDAMDMDNFNLYMKKIAADPGQNS